MKLFFLPVTEIYNEQGELVAENIDIENYRFIFKVPASIPNNIIQKALDAKRDVKWLIKQYPEEFI